MAKPAELFACEYCDKTYHSLIAAENHEKKCKHNPQYIQNQKEERDRKYCISEIEDIRVNATSPTDLIDRIKKFLLSKGIKINFTEYPSRFDMSVCNSHNSPKGYPQNWCGNGDKDGIPRGYPGWSGNWKGSIEVIDPTILGLKKKSVSLSDLTDSWHDGIMKMWFIQTGSGGGVESFSYDGMLWLYDFPKMMEEFNKNNSEFDLLSSEYEEVLKNYKNYFVKERTRYIESANSSIELKRLENQLTDARNELNNVKKQNENFLRNKYNSENGYNLPMPPTAFLKNSKEIMQIHCDVSFNSSVKDADIPKIVQKIKTLNDKLNYYIERNPEEFI